MRTTTGTGGILAPQAGRPYFTLTRQAPAPDLAGHVERHWVVRWHVPPGASFVQELLPHPCVNLVTEPGRVAVHGIPQSRWRRPLEGTGVAVGTKFRPGGLAGFVSVRASELNDRSLALAELFGAAGARLERELERDPAAHVAGVERFLRERLPPPDPRYALVRAAVADALEGGAGTTVAALARRHAVSMRTLQRLFRDSVGVGPGWVLRRYRLHEAAERIAAGEAPDLAALALELGWFDQAHFTRDFTAQVGRSPGEYARACAAAAAMPAAA